MKLRNIVQLVKVNIIAIKKCAIRIAGTLFSMYAIVLTFVSWDDFGDFTVCQRLLAFAVTLVLSLLLAIGHVGLKKSKVIWERGTGKITIRYGDLMEIGFPKKQTPNSIVVIPVNTHFDTIVDEDLSNGVKPLVSINTIHGRWLRKILLTRSVSVLDEDIANSLSAQGLQGNLDMQRTRGNHLFYPIGSTAIIKGDRGVSFFLLALSKFDENNNAQCSEDDFIEAIRKLIAFYDMNGQGYPIYLPMMGTNLSRAGLSLEDSLQKIVSILKLECDKIHGPINIVIFNKERHKVSLWQ